MYPHRKKLEKYSIQNNYKYWGIHITKEKEGSTMRWYMILKREIKEDIGW